MPNRAAQTIPLELELLQAELRSQFDGLIEGVGNTTDEKDRNFLSKAVAAFTIISEAGATPQDAASAVVDGGGDHGIDAIYVDPTGTIWLVQSKFIANGRGEPDLGDVSKFRHGVVDLLAERYDRFNPAVQAKAPGIAAALAQPHRQVRVVLSHTGGAIADQRRQIFADLERQFNATDPDFLRCCARGLSALNDFLLERGAPAKIGKTIELLHFGHIDQPYRGFYGRMSAKILARLHVECGDQLVERNIRRFKGTTAVNDGMENTLLSEASHFFYYNNGITFVCDSIRQIPPFDDRTTGSFRVEGLTVINGAQTLGSIARHGDSHYDTSPAEVLATFISLESTPEDFGAKVTQYRNRQNAVDLEDFAALDERQEVWKQTLAAAGIEYLYKHGEDDPPASETVFSVREAGPALACCQTGAQWADYVAAAKKDKKRLFHRPGLTSAQGRLSEAYERLFSDALTSRELWRIVQIDRVVRETLKGRIASETDESVKSILREGRWLLLHLVLLKTGLREGQHLNLSDQDRQGLSRAIETVAEKLMEKCQAVPWGKQYRSVFESATELQSVKSAVMADLPREI